MADVTALGTIHRKNTPIGGGSKDTELLRDGTMLPAGVSRDTGVYSYDDYSGGGSQTDDWIGWTFAASYTFGKVLFQEGAHFADGGWFTSLTVQVRQSGTWNTVSNLVQTPTYPGTNNGTAYEQYVFTFDPMTGDGCRIFGPPGGTAFFMSVSELRVYTSDASAARPISPVGASAVAEGTTSVVVSYPSGLQEGDRVFAVVQSKGYSTAIAAPSGWQKVIDDWGGGPNNPTGGTDPTWIRTTFFSRVVPQAGLTGTTTFTSGTANVMLGHTRAYRGIGSSIAWYQTPTAVNKFGSNTTWSPTSGQSIPVAADDLVLVVFAAANSAGTTTTLTLTSVSGTELTFDSPTQRPASTYVTTTGDNAAVAAWDVPVTAGSTTVALTTTGSSDAADSGPVSFLRIRADGAAVLADPLRVPIPLIQVP